MEEKLERTREITKEEFGKILNVEFGSKVKLSDFPTMTHMVLKILAEPEVREHDTGKEVLSFYSIKCHCKAWGTDFELKMQIGGSAYKRFVEKNPTPEEYIGKYAFFSKKKYMNTYPQFIHLIKGEYQEKKTVDELLNPATKQPEDTQASSIALKIPPKFTPTDDESKAVKELNEQQGEEWVEQRTKCVDPNNGAEQLYNILKHSNVATTIERCEVLKKLVEI